jgi:hypothetical protein
MTRPIDESWANLPPEKEKVDWDAIIDAEDDERAEVDEIDGVHDAGDASVDDDGGDAIPAPAPEPDDRRT